MLLTMIIEIFFLFLFALMVCSNSVHVRLKPYGAKMCETVCEPPTCEYEFSFQHLECTLSISRTTQDTEKHMMMLATPRSPTPTTQPTTPHQMTSSQGKGSQKVEPGHGLLIEVEGELSIFSFKENSIDYWDDMGEPHVLAVAYLWEEEAALISSRSGIHKLRQNQPRQLFKEMIATVIVVDGELKEIFASGIIRDSHTSGIYRMKYDGINATCIIQFEDSIYNMDLDTKNKFFYYQEHYGNIYRWDYNGEQRTLFLSLPSQIQAIVVDIFNQRMFLLNNNQIQEHDIATENRISKEVDFGMPPKNYRDMAYHNGYLYLTFSAPGPREGFKAVLHIVNVSSNRPREMTVSSISGRSSDTPIPLSLF